MCFKTIFRRVRDLIKKEQDENTIFFPYLTDRREGSVSTILLLCYRRLFVIN